MGAAYSIDLRERVLRDLDSGMTKAELARRYHVTTRRIYNLQKQRDQTGDIAPRHGHAGPQRKLAAHHQQLLALVEQ